MRSLLIIGAHPDDESFFAAGAIAKYVDERARVTVVCATRGERGATGNLCAVEELPSVREQELRDAMNILGVRDLRVLDYKDQQLASAPANEIRRALVAAIRDTRPQVVITFDPNGVNLHSDHIAISRFTSDAAAAATDPRWFPELGAPHTIQRLLWPSDIAVFELAATPAVATLPGTDFVLDVSPWWRKKEAALLAHKTQASGFRRLWFDKPDPARIMSVEAFRFGSGVPPQTRPRDDLFADL